MRYILHRGCPDDKETGLVNFEEAKLAYIKECHAVGAMPCMVTAMTYDPYSEQYTLSNPKDGEFADLYPNGTVVRMHWNIRKGDK